MTPDLLYRILPYGALALFAGGMLLVGNLRRWRTEPQAPAAQTWPKLGGGRLWRCGFIAVLLIHAAVLFLPERVLAWNRTPARLYVLEGVAFAAGLTALAGWVRMLWRHIAASRKELRELCDSVLLSLAGATIGSGLLLAFEYRWASSWASSTLAPYIRSLLTGWARIDLVAGMPFLVRMHIIAAFASLAIIPFTSVGLAAMRASRFAAHTVFMAIAVPREAMWRYAIAQWTNLSLSQWLWPEED